MWRKVPTAWYRNKSWSKILSPLAWLFGKCIIWRRKHYQRKAVRLNVPVIVVGNISVGGTGKTPLVMYLLKQLQQAGWRPGVVSRGYGANAKHYPMLLDANSHAAEVGDEPLMLVRETECPVVVDPKRVRACQYLLANTNCNVIISDDGLQHYALARDIEIAVIDGERRFGNGLLLPAGPLREPLTRLQEVDFVVNQGGQAPGEWTMQLEALCWINVADKQKTLSLTEFAGQKAHAVAGIGHPMRFFASLRELGCDIEAHPFPDHHSYSAQDLAYPDSLPVLMTAKDAVKCTAFAKPNWWYLAVQAELPSEFMIKLFDKLAKRDHHHG